MSTQPYLEVDLWPSVAPGSEAVDIEEIFEERSPDPASYCDRARSGIKRPRMALFRSASPNGTALLLAPGGGYQRVVWDKEGLEVAQWLTTLGVTVAVLSYRLPAEGHANGDVVPLQDAQRAIRILRQRSAEWGIEASRIGAMGFSAGGHLIASLATRFDEKVYESIDAADELSARPDFLALGYPVISMDATITHAGSRQSLLGRTPDPASVKACSADECVRADSPETFIVLADDDAAVPAENAVRYYLALRAAGVKTELHTFRNGGHGFGIRQAKGPVREWTALFENWLRHCGWLPGHR